MDEIGSRALGVLYASGLNAGGGCMAVQHVGGEGSPKRVRSFNISVERRTVTE
jgi:hypothetical protein